MTTADTHTERYELIDRVAIGGMAEVYRAKAFGAHGFEKTLAIKRILPQHAAEPEFEDRFISEAKLAVDLSHANIVQVLDFGRFAGSLFIAMEYVDGLDLAGLLKFMREHDRQVPLPAAFQIAIDICRGLDFAHKHGVIHRDVSPSNILLSQAGEVKVADFGIAEAVSTASTAGGWKQIMGKWRYMSPEQTRGEHLTPRSDLFSLASMFYEMFTGAKLFPGDEAEIIAHNIESMTIPSASEVREGIPERFDEVLRAALARNPDDRTESAAVIQRQLTEICYESSILATPLDVAELVTAVVEEATEEASQRRKESVGGIDDLIRAQLLEGLSSADRETRQTAVEEAERIIEEVEEARKTEETAAPSIVSRGAGNDGISVWEIDRETIAAVPSAIRTGRATGSMPSVGDESSSTGDGSESHADQRRRGVIIGLSAALLAVASLIAMLSLGDDEGAAAVPDAVETTAAVPADAAPSRPRTMLRIDSVPPGAAVEIDGRDLYDQTPTSVVVEPNVKTRVRLSLEGHEPWVDRGVSVPEGETLRIRPRLRRKVATMVVSTLPEGATVTLDGEELGTTPLEKNDLEPGVTRSLTIAKQGFKPVTMTVELRAGNPLRIQRKLQDTRVFGTINLQIDEGWAEVYFRGKKVGRAPIRGLKLPVGKHRLKLVNPPSNKTKIIEVEVAEGEPRYYRTKL